MVAERKKAQLVHKNNTVKTHKESLLAILTSAAEGTLRELAAGAGLYRQVRSEAGSGNHAVKRKERLRASQLSQRPIHPFHEETDIDRYRDRREDQHYIG